MQMKILNVLLASAHWGMIGTFPKNGADAVAKEIFLQNQNKMFIGRRVEQKTNLILDFQAWE